MLRTSRPIGLLALVLSLTLVACDGDDDRDAGPRDAGGALDAGNRDSGTPRDSGTDAGSPVDSGTDAGAVDGGMDAGSVEDGGPVDGGPVDAGPIDAGPPVDGGPFVGGDTCAMAFDVTGGGTFPGTTVGASDTYDDAFPCAYGSGSNGSEVVYSVNPSVETDYRVTVTVAPEDLVPTDGGFRPTLQLWTRTDCGSDECPGGTRGALTFTAAAGVTTFLFVEDQEFIAAGYPFTLDVSIEL